MVTPNVTKQDIENDVCRRFPFIIAFGQRGHIHGEIPGYELVVTDNRVMSTNKPGHPLTEVVTLDVYKLSPRRRLVATIEHQWSLRKATVNTIRMK